MPELDPHLITPKPKTVRSVKLHFNPKTQATQIRAAKKLCVELNHDMYKVYYDHNLGCLASRCRYCGLKFAVFNFVIEGPAMNTLCLTGGHVKK